MKIQKWWIPITLLLYVASSNGAALQFVKMIDTVTSLGTGRLRGYGNFCGFRGRGQPLDNLDRCCQSHDECLQSANRRACFPLFYIAFYIVPYRYMILNGDVSCRSGNSRCQAALCECDSVAAECFREFQNEYNQTLFRG